MKFSKSYKLSLDKFINYSLYDKKNGYYMKKSPFGIRGDFTTAPNISRLFSEMIAIWIINFWESLGSPKKFNLVELGAGNGEMMNVLIQSFKKFPKFFDSCEISISEKSPILKKLQKKLITEKKVSWINDIKKLKKYPCIFIANEFFDAIAIKQLIKKDNNWYEKFVQLNGREKPFYIYKKIYLKNYEKKINHKFSSSENFLEYSPEGIIYLRNLAKIIDKNDGGILIIDYGYFNKKMKNTVQAISNKKFSNILENIGNSDITYNINFHLFREIVKKTKKLDVIFTTQKKFLIKMGIEKRAEIISKNKPFSKKIDIFYRLKRLTGENEMGNLFKVMLIKKQKNKFNIGF